MAGASHYRVEHQRSRPTATTYLGEVIGWSAVWLFAACHAYTLWRLGGWLAG